ncbi:hypothetical protein [Streptacidiphilus fuscans]|uniref:Uncharacterized protein n=1 Tax=Streptacidiphilus fuscans TaxID=2789292 RepID=A0A931B7Q9_9ACTN|nr:hypothetical protein [Streptacidiphilus fuscans]MBF9072760.1 hypothetical protein [Streptacidiphilus fuscans]
MRAIHAVVICDPFDRHAGGTVLGKAFHLLNAVFDAWFFLWIGRAILRRDEAVLWLSFKPRAQQRRMPAWWPWLIAALALVAAVANLVGALA